MASSTKINAHGPQVPPSPAEEPKLQTTPENASSPHPAFAYHASQVQAREASRIHFELSWLVVAGITVAIALIVVLFAWNLSLSGRISAQESTTLDLRLKNQKLSDQLDSILLVSQLKSTTDSLGSSVGTAQQEFDARAAAQLRQMPIRAGNPSSALLAANAFDSARRGASPQTSTALPASAGPPAQYRQPSPTPYRQPSPAPTSNEGNANLRPFAQPSPQQASQPVAQAAGAPMRDATPGANPASVSGAVSRPAPQRSESAAPAAVDMAHLSNAAPGIPSSIPTRSTPMTVVSAPQQKRLMISSGVMSGYRISGAAPQYPAMAKGLHIQGTVVLTASISKAGTIENLRVVRGPLMLQSAALGAVRTWRYKPYLLNGQPVAVDTIVSVAFGPGY